MREQGLVHELRERRIWRVLIAYPVLAFGLLEALAFFIDNYALDSRWLTVGLIVAVVLFPAALLWNWRHGEIGEQPLLKTELAAYAGFLVLAVFAATTWFRQAPPDAVPNEQARPMILARQLDKVAAMTRGAPNNLANLDEALEVQTIVESILQAPSSSA